MISSLSHLARTRAWPIWFALATELLLLLAINRFENFAVAGSATHVVQIVLVAGICYLLAIVTFERLAPALHAPVLWGGAIAFRLCVLFMPPGDDLWRYLWEGNIQLHGFNPYLLNPDAPALAFLREGWWSTINHRDYAAIYPPGVEWIFSRIAGVSSVLHLSLASSVALYKGVFALADLGTIWLLLKLNTGSGRYRATAWYAWNPAVVIAFAGAGHYDSLMLFPLTAAALFLHRANPLGACKPAWSWSLLSAAMLGVAISIKTVPLLLVPIWAFALGWRSIVLATSALIPVAMSLPFGGLDVVTRPFRAFANVSRFNDPVWWVIDRLIWPNPGQQNGRYEVVLFITASVLAVVFRKDWRRGALWIMGAALLLTPVLHPWYVTWILPFACWRKQPAWFVFALSVVLAFLVWDDTLFGAAWSGPSPSLRLFMAAPPLIVCLLPFWRKTRLASFGTDRLMENE